MYGWLDDQVTRVLQRGFVFYAGDIVAWRRLFPAYVVESARDELHPLASKVTAAIAFQHATDVQPPMVTVEVSDGGSPELTYFGDRGDDREYAELGLREAIILRVCAATKHDVRALALATRSILLSYRNRLFLGEWDYSDFRYLSGTAPRANREYFPEDFGSYIATQTWGTMGEAYVPLIEPTLPLTGDILIARLGAMNARCQVSRRADRSSWRRRGRFGPPSRATVAERESRSEVFAGFSGPAVRLRTQLCPTTARDAGW